jgi:transposase-like protein
MSIMLERSAGKADQWRKRIAEQERSGVSVHQFCEEQGLTEQAFYFWRKRLRQQPPARFAVVETGPSRQAATEPVLELVLATGERLRIGPGVDLTTL